MKKLIVYCFFVMVGYSQVAPPPPKPAEPNKQTIGQLQNNTGQVQSKSFAPPPPPPPPMGGAKVKPNPFLQTADLAIIQNPTFEGGFRTGFSCGFSKSNNFGTKSFGGNTLLTFDLSQRAVSLFTSIKNKWFYSYSIAQMGEEQTQGISCTKLWMKNNFILGTQISYSLIDGTDFRIGSPSLVILTNKTFEVGKFKLTPELYNTFSNQYYDRDKSNWDSDFTYNGIASLSFSYRLSKIFVLNSTYRANINTNPKFGLMNNILIGSSFKF